MATSPHSPASTESIDPRTAVGAVSLTVADLARSQEFYERTIGLTAMESADGGLELSASGGPALVRLYGDTSAAPRDPRATGLFHQAILVPDRRALAVALVRIASARWPIDGASNHLVSEALYLSDPDGNGIEIYRDRPRSEWRRGPGGELEMATLPLDLDDLVGELDGPSDVTARMPAGTTIGHVHLQVAELAEIEAFYRGVIGLDVTVKSYPGALFMSAGGYHHHLGLNTWHSAGGARPAPGSVGLRSYELALPEPAVRDAIVARAEEAGVAVADDGDAPLLRDPSGNGVRLALA